jgi:hypothetical protein
MTLDQCRDRLAERKGWLKSTGGSWVRQINPGCVETCCLAHPIPPTLDAIAACMPEGWRWERNVSYWFGFSPMSPNPMYKALKDTGDEKLDRARLAVACWMENEP